jgi:hypothetical protein
VRVGNGPFENQEEDFMTRVDDDLSNLDGKSMMGFEDQRESAVSKRKGEEFRATSTQSDGLDNPYNLKR